MSPERILPEDPLAFIRHCIGERKVLWTYHVNMRLEARFIPREAILDSSIEFQIIESYPNDKYLPSYLVWAKYEGDVFHILFAADVPNSHVRVVTAYRPNREDWEADLKTRRRRP